MAAAPASPFILRVGTRACTGGLPLGLGFFGFGQRLRKAGGPGCPRRFQAHPGAQFGSYGAPGGPGPLGLYSVGADPEALRRGYTKNCCR